MRIIILIITVLFCFNVSAQDIKYSGTSGGQVLMKKGDSLKTTPIEKVDTMDISIISMKELSTYLERINTIVQKQFDISQTAKYNLILMEIQRVYMEANKKKKVIK